MIGQDLRSFLQAYEQTHSDEVWHIYNEVDADYTITAYTLASEKSGLAPLLIFEKVKGYAIPIVTNVFGSRRRIAFLLGEEKQMAAHWARVTATLIKPTMISTGPIKEVIWTKDRVDLGKLPILRHFEQDAGRYITSGVVVAKDPDNNVRNLSFHRLQVKGERRLGVSLHSRGHLWDYFRRSEEAGKPLEVAVVIGAHPAVLLAAASKVDMDTDEYDIAGALLGEPLQLVPCETVGLEVPAYAEIVLEGRILPQIREPEGPFGEYTGYATGRSTENVLEVESIMMRRHPIYLDVCPGFSSDHLLLGRVQKEAAVWQKMREVLPDVKAIYYPKSGTHFHAYIALAKKFEGQPRQAALLLLGLDPYVKLIVVVDEDIDLNNEEEMMWALATRMQADRDVSILSGVMCNLLDPSSTGGMSAKMIIDATASLDMGVVKCTVPQAVMARVQSDIGERLGQTGER
ncbi:MAG: UbiD family decarboxylase [Chloroflexi bacterium]|nr:UbiD family decarboxylase [Chloroflexota bacterium]